MENNNVGVKIDNVLELYREKLSIEQYNNIMLQAQNMELQNIVKELEKKLHEKDVKEGE